ncbi:glycosyltransferase [Acinetobacter sp.]|uniref:glycosyltransferase n=1 Tax=Acinetobacter sp. TaxID=472 RepID=UPI002FCB418B
MKGTKLAFFMRWAQGGGAERVMIALANQFAAAGYRVDFVFVNAQGKFIQDIDPRIQIVDLKAQRAVFAGWHFYRYLRQEQPHAVISALNYINIFAILAALLMPSHKPKLIITEHGTLGATSSNLKGRARLVPKLMQWLYPFAQHVVAVSNGVADDLAQQIALPRKKIVTIYNPINFAGIELLKAQPLQHPWAEQDIPVVLGAGRLVDVKNFPLLIQAFLQVRKTRPCRLVILGEGEKRSELEELTQASAYAEDICLMGFSENPYPWMARADAFVLSSDSEGLPTVLIEAIACGAPVISTDCPHGPREILQDGAYGMLVPVNDAQQMAQAIAHTLQQPAQNQNSVQPLLEKFQQRRAFQAYQQLLD